MDPTDATNPAPETEQQEVENEATNINEADAANEGDDPESQASEPEFDDVEIDGKTYRVPKEIAPHVMKNQDYTQKTQALAEQRRAWEAQTAEYRQTMQREAEIFESLKTDEAQRIGIEERLTALRNVNVNALHPSDQLRYTNEIQQLQWAHGDLMRNLEAKRGDLEAEREQSFANLWGQTMEALSKPDEKLGWHGRYDEPTQLGLVKFLQEAGLGDTRRIRETLAEPLGAKIVNLAKIGLATIQKQQQALSAKPKPLEAKPVPTVSGAKAKGSVDMDKLSPEEWVKARNKQVMGRR